MTFRMVSTSSLSHTHTHRLARRGEVFPLVEVTPRVSILPGVLLPDTICRKFYRKVCRKFLPENESNRFAVRFSSDRASPWAKSRCPAKPHYDMAPDGPLLLHECRFRSLDFQYTPEVGMRMPSSVCICYVASAGGRTVRLKIEAQW